MGETEHTGVNKLLVERLAFSVVHPNSSLFSCIRYWEKCHLRSNGNTSGCLPDDVSRPVLPQAAKHYGKCAALLASICSDEGVVGGRIHWGASGVRGPGKTVFLQLLMSI